MGGPGLRAASAELQAALREHAICDGFSLGPWLSFQLNSQCVRGIASTDPVPRAATRWHCSVVF